MQSKVAVFLVYKTGGDFDWEYVTRLATSINEFLPFAPVYVLTDDYQKGNGLATGARFTCVPLWMNLPGWWSKMELFRPGIKGDILYFDLDTIITGDLHQLAAVDQLTVLDNWEGDGGIGSGMMYLPEKCRAFVWEVFTNNPTKNMNQFGPYAAKNHRGDQGFLRAHGFEDHASRWQTLYPDAVLSYKRDEVALKGIKPRTRVVCFHGKPRPKDVAWDLSASQKSNQA